MLIPCGCCCMVRFDSNVSGEIMSNNQVCTFECIQRETFGYGYGSKITQITKYMLIKFIKQKTCTANPILDLPVLANTSFCMACTCSPVPCKKRKISMRATAAPAPGAPRAACRDSKSSAMMSTAETSFFGCHPGRFHQFQVCFILIH